MSEETKTRRPRRSDEEMIAWHRDQAERAAKRAARKEARERLQAAAEKSASHKTMVNLFPKLVAAIGKCDDQTPRSLEALRDLVATIENEVINAPQS